MKSEPSESPSRLDPEAVAVEVHKQSSEQIKGASAGLGRDKAEVPGNEGAVQSLPTLALSQSPEPAQPRSRFAFVRSLVRQWAAAVYVILALSMFGSLLSSLPFVGLLGEALLVVLAGGLLAWVSDGSRIASVLVGFWVSLFSLLVALSASDWEYIDALFWVERGLYAGWLMLLGGLGALLFDGVLGLKSRK